MYETQPLVCRFARSVWCDYLKSVARLPETVETGEAIARGNGKVINCCHCEGPCGAVKCAPGMRYEWPTKWPKLPE